MLQLQIMLNGLNTSEIRELSPSEYRHDAIVEEFAVTAFYTRGIVPAVAAGADPILSH